MRLFFLIFLLLFGVVGNWAIYDSSALLSGFGAVTFNVFLLSLFLMWWFGYFASAGSRVRGLAIAHAMSTFALGAALILLSVDVVVYGSCGSDVSNQRAKLGQEILSYARAHGFCREIGIAGVGMGGLLAYPSVRLFLALWRGR